MGRARRWARTLAGLPQRLQDLLKGKIPDFLTAPPPQGMASRRSRTKCGQSRPADPRNSVISYEQPVVVPQVMHLRQVPLRTMVNWPHSPHGSPS
jgi:hypothetical protein